MVNLMSTLTASPLPIDWSNFNSSLIIEVTRPEGVFTSTGVAINANTVLTAAHCLEGKILKVRVSNASSYDATGAFFEVKSFELHPEYDSETSAYRSDIAKIKLKGNLPKDTIFFPIAKNLKNLNGKLLRLGFGSRGNGNVRTLVSPQYKNLRSHEGTLELNDIYSYSGDSGGPVLLQQDGQVYLIALHSTLSFGPEGKFSFNPLLSTHRTWILG